MNLFTNLQNPTSRLSKYILNIYTYKHMIFFFFGKRTYDIIYTLIKPHACELIHKHNIMFELGLFNT